MATPDGRVRLAPAAFLAAKDKLERDFERERAFDDSRFRLITRRSHRTHNSWTQNALELTSKGDQSNHLYMHPEDAAKTGLASGDVADVTSEVTTLRLPIRFLPELMRGTVALPQLFDATVQTVSGTVLADGLLATVTFDTTEWGPEFIGTSWPLMMTELGFGTFGTTFAGPGPPEWFGEIPTEVVNGNVTIIPEPSTSAMLMLGAIGLLLWRLKRLR